MARLDRSALSRLRRMLLELRRLDCAYDFLHPVRVAECANYETLIDKPMDLTTLEAKLDGGDYVTLSEVAADMQLISTNCERYATAQKYLGWESMVEQASAFRIQAEKQLEQVLAEVRPVDYREDVIRTDTSAETAQRTAQLAPTVTRKAPRPRAGAESGDVVAQREASTIGPRKKRKRRTGPEEEVVGACEALVAQRKAVSAMHLAELLYVDTPRRKPVASAFSRRRAARCVRWRCVPIA